MSSATGSSIGAPLTAILLPGTVSSTLLRAHSRFFHAKDTALEIPMPSHAHGCFQLRCEFARSRRAKSPPAPGCRAAWCASTRDPAIRAASSRSPPFRRYSVMPVPTEAVRADLRGQSRLPRPALDHPERRGPRHRPGPPAGPAGPLRNTGNSGPFRSSTSSAASRYASTYSCAK